MEIASSFFSGLVSTLFNIILTLFDITFFPIVSVVTAMFPPISSYASNVLLFIDNYIVPYVKFGLSFLYNLVGLPPQFVGILMTYFIFLITGKYTMVAVQFAISVYQKLKP